MTFCASSRGLRIALLLLPHKARRQKGMEVRRSISCSRMCTVCTSSSSCSIICPINALILSSCASATTEHNKPLGPTRSFNCSCRSLSDESSSAPWVSSWDSPNESAAAASSSESAIPGSPHTSSHTPSKRCLRSRTRSDDKRSRGLS